MQSIRYIRMIIYLYIYMMDLKSFVIIHFLYANHIFNYLEGTYS